MAELESIEKPLAEWVKREMKATDRQRADAIHSLFLSLADDTKWEVWRWMHALCACQIETPTHPKSEPCEMCGFREATNCGTMAV